jgi:hypothetical protein
MDSYYYRDQSSNIDDIINQYVTAPSYNDVTMQSSTYSDSSSSNIYPNYASRSNGYHHSTQPNFHNGHYHSGTNTQYYEQQQMASLMAPLHYHGNATRPNAQERVTFVPNKRMLLLPGMRHQQQQALGLGMGLHHQHHNHLGGSTFGSSYHNNPYGVSSSSAALDLAQPYETMHEDLAFNRRIRGMKMAAEMSMGRGVGMGVGGGLALGMEEEGEGYVLDKLTLDSDGAKGDRLIKEIKEADRKFAKSMQQLSSVSRAGKHKKLRNKNNASNGSDSAGMFDSKVSDADTDDSDD